ncbi:MAG: helix-turn-helix transcriptional regulator [Lachnospiraceae bacterium]|nr:helix-turn-helix transcriptional regulator [Lachnospiraceae bacterium]
MYLAQNLKFLRERNGEMQKDIAELLSVSKQTASVYEKGEIEPDIEKLIKLADHYETTIDDLLRKDLRPPKPMCARNLKHLREKNGFKQKEIGDLIKTKYSVVSKYESGQVEIPLTKIMQLADFFGISLDQFVKQDLSEAEHEQKNM